MLVTPDVRSTTGLGKLAEIGLFEPRPNWPLLLEAQHCAAPETTAQEVALPNEILLTPDVRPNTCTGTLESVAKPSPSLPMEPLPQHLAAPETTAQVWKPPSEILLTPEVKPTT